jgi:hypothetical protein
MPDRFRHHAARLRLYNRRMRNWSVNTSRFEKNSDEYEIWQLEQLLNFGMSEGKTLDRKQLEKHLPVLAIDQDTRSFLEYVLYSKELDIISPRERI